MIEMREVACGFDDRLLFKDVNLALRRGEIVLLKGESGCGKTTFLRLLVRFLPLTAGQLLLDGRPYDTYRYEALRARVAYLHQTPVMEPGLSVRENLLVPFSFAIHRDRERPGEQVLRELCEAFRLPAGILDREASGLSVGERQRVAILRARLLEPEFLLLDEPTANLDPESVRAIGEWIEDRARARTGIVIASHQPVAGLAGRGVRVLEIAEGRVHELGH